MALTAPILRAAGKGSKGSKGSKGWMIPVILVGNGYTLMLRFSGYQIVELSME